MRKWLRASRRTGGFTLVEMLIVVAIIAVLVAVSIPVVGASLEKAREATDAANERAAKAVALTDFLMNGYMESTTYFYKSDGTVLTQRALEGHTQSVEGTPGSDSGQSKDHKGSCVKVEIIVFNGEISATSGWLTIK